MKDFILLARHLLGSRRRFALIVAAFTSIPALAGLSSQDIVGTTRSRPTATLGALEPEMTAPALPATPQGVALILQKVTL